jgi:hypothetical protein
MSKENAIEIVRQLFKSLSEQNLTLENAYRRIFDEDPKNYFYSSTEIALSNSQCFSDNEHRYFIFNAVGNEMLYFKTEKDRDDAASELVRFLDENPYGTEINGIDENSIEFWSPGMSMITAGIVTHELEEFEVGKADNGMELSYFRLQKLENQQ